MYSRWWYSTTFFGIVDLLTIAPWYIELVLTACGIVGHDASDVFRLIRLFRLLELEHFITAFTILDNVICRSKGVLIATGVLAFSIWLCAGAMFFLFEKDNPNWCKAWADETCAAKWEPSCVCASPSNFDTMPHSLFYTAIFLAGEWPVVDFTIGGKICCLAMLVIGIGLAALPVGTLFDSFGEELEKDGDDESENEASTNDKKDV